MVPIFKIFNHFFKMKRFKFIQILLAFFALHDKSVCLNVAYGNKTDSCGKNRAAGVKTRMYAVPVAEIDEFPILKTTTGAGDTLTYDGDITLVSTTGLGYFRSIDIITDTGEVMSDFVGDQGGKAWKNSFKFFLAGTAVENREWAHKFSNTCSVVLVASREKPDTYMVLGSPTDPVIFDEVKMSTKNKVGEGAPGFAFALRDPSGNPVYEYAGAVDVTPA